MIFDFKLSYQQKWENVSSIRHFISEMLSSELFDLIEAKRVSTATSELIENVVKYSTENMANLAIKCCKEDSTMTLIATNSVSNKRLIQFESIFQEIHAGDPKKIYKEMMLRSLCETQVSQLGLARIRYECHGEISYQVSRFHDSHLEFKKLPNLSKSKLLTITVKIPVLERSKDINNKKVTP